VRSPSPVEWVNDGTTADLGDTAPMRSYRIQVLEKIGELLDNEYIEEYYGKYLIKFIFLNNYNLFIIHDILNSRRDDIGKSQFLKFFVDGKSSECPTPPPSVPLVPVVFDWSDTASPIDPTTSGFPNDSPVGVPLLIPRAIRLNGGAPEIPKDSLDSMRSTNPCSSIDVSPPNILSLTRETTGTSLTSPPKEWKNNLIVVPCDERLGKKSGGFVHD
jgi:hypothetical protein